MLVVIGLASLPFAVTSTTVDIDDVNRNSKQSPSSLPPQRDHYDIASTTATAAAADSADRRQFSDCDYFEYLVPNKSYDIYSPGYANETVYDANTNCRWTAVAPAEHSIRLDCGDMYMPKVCVCVCV